MLFHVVNAISPLPHHDLWKGGSICSLFSMCEFMGEGIVEKFTNGMALTEEWFEEWLYVSVRGRKEE